jgi:hypothetical protein
MDRATRGRYTIGGQHKLAGVDVAYSLLVICRSTSAARVA